MPQTPPDVIVSAPLLDSPKQLTVPSWLLSILLHLALLITLGLLVRAPRPMGIAEGDRAAGIVLAQLDQADQVVYFEQSGRGDQQQATSAERAAAASAASLPDQEAMPAVTDIQLPGSAAPAPPTDHLMARPTLSKGGKVRLLPGQGAAEILAEEAARRRAIKPAGPTGRVSLFGSAPAIGRTFMFVIDRSNSMGSGGLGALRVAAVEFQRALATLQPTHRFQILAYHHDRVFFGDERFVPATAENKQRISKFISGLAAFGGTDHEMALMSALYRKPDVIFFLTDGGDPRLSASQLAKIHKQAAGRTTIHCIQFGYGPTTSDDTFMKRLARENGGSYRYIDMSKWTRKPG